MLRLHTIHRALAFVSGTSSSSSQSPSPSSPSAPHSHSPSQTQAQHLQRPYEIEGGAVPIYQMISGRISKRNWVFRNPAWCDLCKEPVSLWVNHHGRKDHALMDLHYSAQVEYPRNWNPQTLLCVFNEYSAVSFEAYQRCYARYDRERRDEIFAMIRFLAGEGVLYLGEPRQTYLSRMIGGLRGMDHQGSLVLHKHLLGPFLRMYPDGCIQDFSNLTDFITCAYNMETVYDLCGFQGLDLLALEGHIKLGASSPAALGLGGIAASSTAAHGYSSSGGTAGAAAAGSSASTPGSSNSSTEMSEQEHEDAFSRKAVFIRMVLGQLRWATVDDQVHPTGRVYPHHIVLACELLVKMLVVEIIAVRIAEYVVRVEPVWIQHGLERKKVKSPKEIANRDVTPGFVRYSYRPMSPNEDDHYYT